MHSHKHKTTKHMLKHECSFHNHRHTHRHTRTPLNPFNAISSAECWLKRPMGLTKAHLNMGKWNWLWKITYGCLNIEHMHSFAQHSGQKMTINWWWKICVIDHAVWCNESSWWKQYKHQYRCKVLQRDDNMSAFPPLFNLESWLLLLAGLKSIKSFLKPNGVFLNNEKISFLISVSKNPFPKIQIKTNTETLTQSNFNGKTKPIMLMF